MTLADIKERLETIDGTEMRPDPDDPTYVITQTSPAAHAVNQLRDCLIDIVDEMIRDQAGRARSAMKP